MGADLNTIDHEQGRDHVLNDLKRELVGPDPCGKEIDCSMPIVFSAENWTGIFGPWRQKDSGEEILCIEPPTRRYGIGVLYPIGIQENDPRDDKALISSMDGISDEPGGLNESLPVSPEDVLSKSAKEDLEKIEKRPGIGQEFSKDDDIEFALTNVRNPSALGISFLAEIPKAGIMNVVTTFGLYEALEVASVTVKGKFSRQWWLRRPFKFETTFNSDEIISQTHLRRSCEVEVAGNKIDLSIDVVSRPMDADRTRLLTVSLVNRTSTVKSIHAVCMFQSRLEASLADSESMNFILPYPQSGGVSSASDEENDSFDLLYRNAATFSVGHGCCGNWTIAGGEINRANLVFADVLPEVRIPNVTPDVFHKDAGKSQRLEVSMRSLAGLGDEAKGWEAIGKILTSYENWIVRQEKLGSEFVQPKYREAASRHTQLCRSALGRMRAGLEILRSADLHHGKIRRAFQLANHAMLLQQLRNKNVPRPIRWDEDQLRIIFEGKQADTDAIEETSSRGTWRPFQIAFLLLALESTARGESPERQAVELIWFPTGGGKTEAYLGLSAFSIFLRRLTNPSDKGTQVLMRYTLRLLTAQQFQRASALICAMESLRIAHADELGNQHIRIGVWLGANVTPNNRKDALSALSKLNRTGDERDNCFVITKCPWCNSPLGLTGFKSRDRRRRGLVPQVIGYRVADGTVVYHCPDPKCLFHDTLPIVTVDDDVYASPPEIVIGTVDKFAQLAWDPSARRIFGISPDGTRFASPPGLIVQDELHLISGPLGSMVGAYELLIEELCTDRRGQIPIAPKIITSTATIRRYKDQIRALFARSDARLFPSPGLEASDNFFSSNAKKPNGSLSEKIFLGVHGTTLGSLQTAQVRVLTSLLQSPVQLPTKARDPWWTNLIYFNSLRELGTTVSLFQSDIPYRLVILGRRYGMQAKDRRDLNHVKELTSRLDNSAIPKSIDELSKGVDEAANVIDACLASSIIEVGVDIDRLSLMVIVGQPKTTASYIQVAGRVGRRWAERPGLVVTLLSPTKPRDRSHYEKFRSYHERLYAEVEPTSVTPFSPPAVERALHAVLAAFVRQMGNQENAAHPMPFPEQLVDKFVSIVKDRVGTVDASEWSYVDAAIKRRVTEWKNWHRQFWEARGGHGETPLMYRAGNYVNAIDKERSWATPNSMRNVDAECRMIISQLYLPPAERA